MGNMIIKISWSFGWNGVLLFFGKSQVRGPALPLLDLLLTVVAHVVDWKWWVNGVISGCYVVATFPSLTPRSLNGKKCLVDLPRPTVGVHALRKIVIFRMTIASLEIWPMFSRPNLLLWLYIPCPYAPWCWNIYLHLPQQNHPVR